MKFDIQDVRVIEERLQDDISINIFQNRMSFSMTKDYHYMRKIFRTIPLGQKFESILEKNKDKKLILFGAGKWGRWIKQAYDNYDWYCFADNKISENIVDGIPVICAEELECYTDAFIIITSKFHWKEIKAQLQKTGISEENYFCFGELIWQIEQPIYFDLPELQTEEKEIFVDAGGYNGETTSMFLEWAKGRCEAAEVYIFEPDAESKKKCEALFGKLKNVTIIPKGLWNKRADLQFISDGSDSRIVETAGKADSVNTTNAANTVSVVTLDKELANKEITFIKMDIEGAELKALQGAEKIIRTYKPKMAISVYHKPEDIIEIPRLLLAYNPEYRFWLRHYSLSWFDTVLYAV